MLHHPKLYIKEGCPWCAEAIEWLDRHEFKYEKIEVRNDKNAFDKLIEISGQTKTPTLQMPDGRILPDFGVEELSSFLNL